MPISSRNVAHVGCVVGWEKALAVSAKMAVD